MSLVTQRRLKLMAVACIAACMLMLAFGKVGI